MSKPSDKIEMRPASDVMRLDRMGSMFQSRISFMRRLIRLMNKENWSVKRKMFCLNAEGYGRALYVVKTRTRYYSLVVFSHALDPDSRTDRVIAEQWDATFCLFDGIPSSSDIIRLSTQTPLQEAGRFQDTEIVLSRANKSLRLFNSVVSCLSKGKQPSANLINEIGYLMRTTAVYGNGKFGLADRSLYLGRPELAPPFQAEMLTVYLIREFSLDLVEHLAKSSGSRQVQRLDNKLKRHVGVGNATGLGMAPFLVSHPALIHQWFSAKEKALFKIRQLETAPVEKIEYFKKILGRVQRHVVEWNVGDNRQTRRIIKIEEDLLHIKEWVSQSSEIASTRFPWDILFRKAEGKISMEAQELLVSLLLEPYPELIDTLGENLHINAGEYFNPSMSNRTLLEVLDKHYQWALSMDLSKSDQSYFFWYYSDEKVEPRRGLRAKEAGAEKEMRVTIAHDIQELRSILVRSNKSQIVAHFLMAHPKLRHTVKRVQGSAELQYAEIQDNITAKSCSPIDILRGKLAFFGASKFDPKSDLWTRITMCQGAPLRDELDKLNADDWCFPVKPDIDICVYR